MLWSATKGLLWFISVYHLMPELPLIFFNLFTFTVSFHQGLLGHLSRVKYTFSLQSWTSAVLKSLKNPAVWWNEIHEWARKSCGKPVCPGWWWGRSTACVSSAPEQPHTKAVLLYMAQHSSLALEHSFLQGTNENRIFNVLAFSEYLF